MERRYGEGHEGQPQSLVVEQPPASFAEAGSFTIYVIVIGIFLYFDIGFSNVVGLFCFGINVVIVPFDWYSIDDKSKPWKDFFNVL